MKNNLIITFFIAFGAITLGLLGMGFGYFFTKKKKILTKQCGINPDEAQDESCSKKKHCFLCDKEEKHD